MELSFLLLQNLWLSSKNLRVANVISKFSLFTAKFVAFMLGLNKCPAYRCLFLVKGGTYSGWGA